jgi:hypothetical protein
MASSCQLLFIVARFVYAYGNKWRVVEVEDGDVGFGRPERMRRVKWMMASSDGAHQQLWPAAKISGQSALCALRRPSLVHPLFLPYSLLKLQIPYLSMPLQHLPPVLFFNLKILGTFYISPLENASLAFYTSRIGHHRLLFFNRATVHISLCVLALIHDTNYCPLALRGILYPSYSYH